MSGELRLLCHNNPAKANKRAQRMHGERARHKQVIFPSALACWSQVSKAKPLRTSGPGHRRMMLCHVMETRVFDLLVVCRRQVASNDPSFRNSSALACGQLILGAQVVNRLPLRVFPGVCALFVRFQVAGPVSNAQRPWLAVGVIVAMKAGGELQASPRPPRATKRKQAGTGQFDWRRGEEPPGCHPRP